MKEVKNRHGRRRPSYKTIANHKTKLNAQDKPETVKLTLNNGFHTMDGKLERGWSVGSINTGREVFKEFGKAADKFEEMTGERPPTPEFETESGEVRP